MGEKKMIYVGEQTFKNWKAAKECARNILNSYDMGVNISRKDQEFLTSALRLRGSEGEQKIGCEIKRIYIGSDGYEKRCFYLERNDGSTTDFSYIKCFSGHTKRSKKSPKMKDFEAACRTAIMSDKIEVGRESNIDNVDVHHEQIPFKELVKTFIKERQIKLENVKFLGHEDNSTVIRFEDEQLENDFRVFHDNNAILVPLSKEEHKKRHKNHTVNHDY
ncbi:MAG: DCL family protein [Methanothrix sp.]|nr:DCL family protein [Methanothrix harundinacea]MDD2638739.1 DCL family protein [Methanothrix sp.]MDD3710280.1 DCL family protein [Methanothrix sp.]MDD5767211.1 DCL family protein [Methanothrix sp.]MDI9399914.1 DCL family protein [Euryarchaeota archaeon]